MFEHLKQYTTLALYALLLNIALLFPAHLLADQKIPTQEATTQSVENVVEDNEQSDKKQIKKPTMRESWRKVVTLRLKELSRADAWNIGVPIVGAAALGYLLYYYSQTNHHDVLGVDDSDSDHDDLDGNADATVSLANMNQTLPFDVQRNVALYKISDFLLIPKILPKEHTKWTNNVAISNRAMVTGSSDHTAKIWHLNGQLLHTLVGHTDVVLSVAIHGDNVVTGSQDKTAKIWNLSGELLHTLEGYVETVEVVAISDDKVVTGDMWGIVKLWDINGELLHTFIHTKAVASVAISSEKMVAGFSDGTIKIWNIDGQLLQTFKGHTGDVRSIAMNNDIIVTGSYGGTVHNRTVKIWNFDGQLLRRLKGHTDMISSVAIQGDKIITASNDGTAKIWHINGQLRHTLKITDSNPIRFSAAISDDIVVTGSYGDVMIWSLYIDLNAPEFITEESPLAWIKHNLTIPQAAFIARALKATQAGQEFIIALPNRFNYVDENESQEQADGRIYFTFPDKVREYLQTRLIIRKS